MNRGVAFAIAGALFAAGFAVRGLVQPKPAPGPGSSGPVTAGSPATVEEEPKPAGASPVPARVLSARGDAEPFAGRASTAADLGARFRAALSGGSSQARQEELRRWAAGLSAAEMRSAVGYVGAMGSRREREAAMRALVARWGAVDAAGAMAYVESLSPGSEQERLMAGVIEGLASVSPETAAEALRQLPDAARNQALPRVLRELAARDPQAALRLHAEFFTAGGRASESALRGIFQEWASADPTAALSAASASSQGGLKRVVAEQWAYDQPVAAARALSGSGDAGLLAVAMETWARDDPKAASAYVASVPGADLRSAAARAVARAWARTEPVEAGAWAGRGALADGMEAGHVLGEVVQQWAPKDPDATGRWLETLPPGLSRDVAVRYYAWKIEDMDAGAAVQWASTIRQDQLRVTQQETAARAWLKQDQTAARAWIARSGLSAEAKARLLNPAGARP